jgi:hypothetical protein
MAKRPIKHRIEFRATTSTGKHFVANTFFECLIGAAETMEIEQHNVRVLVRSEDSWYVYRSEADMLTDTQQRQRANWCALISRAVTK